MPTDGDFGVRLVVGGGDDGAPQRDLDEVTDTLTGRVYAVSRAGDEYKIKMSGPGDKHVGAIIQVDGACDMSCTPSTMAATGVHCLSRSSQPRTHAACIRNSVCGA
jgi:hypothetical protein